VKFLDEHGGGVVSRIISHNLVHVAIEDGFEIPTLVNNLILSADIEKSFSQARQQAPAAPGPPVPEPEEALARDEPLPRLWGRKEMPEGVYFAYVPQDQKWLVTGRYDLFLINHTPWELIYSLYYRDEEGVFEGRDYDVIPASSRIHLASIRAERLDRWSEGTLQLLFRRDKAGELLLPASIDFRIRSQRFVKEGAFQEYSFIEGKALIVTLVTLSGIGRVGKAPLKEDRPAATAQAKPEQEEELIHAYRKGEREAEVDLHIGSLMEDYSDFGKHDLLNIQLGHFLACLESGIRCAYRRIVFIHGVGGGKLKQEIEARLKDYPDLQWEDAPLRDYGQGAIVVRLFQGRP